MSKPITTHIHYTWQIWLHLYNTYIYNTYTIHIFNNVHMFCTPVILGQIIQLGLIESLGSTELRGYPATSISGNNIRKYLLESDFLASYSGIPPYFPATWRKYSNFRGGIPLQLATKSLSSKNFRTLFPEILVVRYPL